MNFDFFDEEPQSLKIYNNEQNIITDLLKLFAFVTYNKIPLLKNNKIRKNNYTKILKNFILVKDAAYLDFLLNFSTTNHFMIHHHHAWNVDQTKVIDFFKKPEHALRTIFSFMKEKILVDKKNKIILHTLHNLPPNRWINFEKFYKYLISLSKSFIDPPSFFKNKYYANKQILSNKQMTENLFAMELFWCGIVKIAFNKQQNRINLTSSKEEIIEAITEIVKNNNLNPEQLENLSFLDVERLREIYNDLFRLTKLDFDLSHFTITALGKSLMEDKNISSFFKRKTSKFVIQPNFEIVVPPFFDEIKYFQLLSLVETIKTETLNTFKISKQSIYNAILNGMKKKDLIKFLKENSESRVPSNLIELIEDCFSQFNKIELYNDKYILKASRVIIKKIEKDPVLSQCIRAKLNAETIVLKNKNDIKILTDKYKSLGLHVNKK